MGSVVIYIIKTGYFRLSEFFRHWYIGGARRWYAGFLSVLYWGERSIAVRANLYFLLSPLYQERNITGFIMGFFVRLFRIIGGGIVYIGSALFFVVTFFIWAALPIVCIYKGIILFI